MHSDNLSTELFRSKVLSRNTGNMSEREAICRSMMFCRCCRAIKDRDLNMSAGRTQQSNHRVTYIMKHPPLSSLSRPLYCVEQYRTDSLASCKTRTHNIQNRHGLKVTWHHWPSSIWTLLCCTLHRRWQCLDQEIWLRLIVELSLAKNKYKYSSVIICSS